MVPAPAKMSDASPTPSPAPDLPYQRARILYADDMKELRELISIVLSKEGHLVETVADGRFALKRLTADPEAFDLLITDHQMPDMNGLELVTAVRRTAYRGKIMIFSSELSHEVGAAYVALAVDHVLQKPVLPAALRQLVRKMFSTPA